MHLTGHVLRRLNIVFTNPWIIILVSLTIYYPPPTFLPIILNKNITGFTKTEHFSIVIQVWDHILPLPLSTQKPHSIPI